MWSDEFNCWVFPLFHPAYCLRDQKHFAKWRPDITKAVQFALSGFKNEVDLLENSEYRDVDSIDFILEQKDITVAFDTETQGVDWTNSNSVVISYSVSTTIKNGYNVWLAYEVEDRKDADLEIKWARKTGKKIVDQRIFIKKAPYYERRINELRELCRRPDIKIFMMNGNYDLHRLAQLGIHREEVKSYTLDIQSAMHALDPDNFKSASLLDIQSVLIPERVDHKTGFAAQVDKNDMLGAAKQDPKRHTEYACSDTASTLECGLILRKRLLNDQALARYYTRLAHPVESEILYEIEKNGILFDIEKLPEVKNEVAKIIRQKEREVLRLVPSAVLDMPLHKEKGHKLTRTDFIRDILFHKNGFGLKPLEKTPTGAIATGRNLLARIRDDLEDDHPAKELLSIYFEWGPYQKLYSTYLKGFEQAVKSDGRLHTQISKTFTATARTGSRNPSLQTIPKRNPLIKGLIRQLLKAAPGKVLVAVDESQSELRWTAQDSRDPTFVRTFRESGDLHVETAKVLVTMSGKHPEKMNSEELAPWRQKAKAGNFGLIYGMHPKGFQAYARDNYGVRFTLEEATRFRNNFFSKYYGLAAWHERRIAEGRRYGYVRTPFGSIRRLPNINSEDFMKKSEDERIAINTPIQAGSNDVTLFSAKYAKDCKDIDWGRAQLVLFIHDELVYEVDEDYTDQFIRLLIPCMEHPPLKQYFGFDMIVPLVAEAEYGYGLNSLKDYKL